MGHGQNHEAQVIGLLTQILANQEKQMSDIAALVAAVAPVTPEAA